MGRVAVLATCALNQWALDYQGNVDRIIDSVQKAKAARATYLCGTEISIVGYGAGDHYHERDTEIHAWEALATIMQHPACADIMVDVGLPVMHKNVIYNCKLIFLNRKVLLIRPKMMLADDGSMGYCETRWFTAWTKVREVEDYQLPSVIENIAGQRSAPLGDGIIATRDTTLGFEICEELWNPESCHVVQCLDGVEIIANGLASMEEYGRPGIAYQLVQMASMKSGGCYLLANQKGSDGGHGYYPGDACIGLNGSIVAYATIHTVQEVDVITAAVDLESIRRYKGSIRSRCICAAKSKSYPRIEVDFSLASENWMLTGLPSCNPIEPLIPTKEEQILKVPACWLWDYLRRSEHRGLLLPLSGDVDSSAVAAIVFSMCNLLVDAAGDDKVLADVRRLLGQNDYVLHSSMELCGRLVQTLFVETVSSPGTKEIVDVLSKQIGSQLSCVDLENPLQGIMKSIAPLANTATKQNLESRLTLAVAYFFAESSIIPDEPKKNLIVLASSNADNNLRGSDIKYGKTYGDINLIGHYPKEDLIRFLLLAKKRLVLPVLEKLNLQLGTDEEATCTYLQALDGCGPYSMFGRLWHTLREVDAASEVAEKVKKFFCTQSIQHRNRIGLPPSFCMPSVGPPHVFGPLLYPREWTWQFRAIDDTVKKIETMKNQDKKPTK